MNKSTPHHAHVVTIDRRLDAEHQHCERAAQQYAKGWSPEDVVALLKRERADAYERGFCNGSPLDIVLFKASDGTWIGMCDPVAQVPFIRCTDEYLAHRAMDQLVQPIRDIPAPPYPEFQRLAHEFAAILQHAEFWGGVDELAFHRLDRSAAEQNGCKLPSPESIPLTSEGTIVERGKESRGED